MIFGNRYQLHCRKKTATSDGYLFRSGCRKTSVCEGCRSVYMNKRWYSDSALYEQIRKRQGTVKTICPACLKVRDDFPGGIVTLKGNYIIGHKQELLNLIRNEEGRARGFNPLERVIAIRENGSAKMIVTTTNEKLAQRLGRAIKKAFHGGVAYNWSQDNKLLRVNWERAA